MYLYLKAMEAAEPGELVLGNWKSQGAASDLSVLDDHEVLFPMVQVGTHHSKWITVKNPSQQPVVMQLILNSGEIIDDCRTTDGLLQHSSSSSLVLSEHMAPNRFGFSIAESTLTEAYVHPYETASFGPIFFLPSNRCEWKSSLLIRNNLSGVEWLSLRGFGGSFSLLLFEGSKPVQSLEFKLNLPSSLNFSSDVLYLMEETTYACSQPLSKELYAKNTGDLPLEVRRIEVSGAECGLDGFVVHPCEGFALEPGESTKLLISYRADFSAVVVQRDLELALGTGILVIPMRASLPLHMLNSCKKSMFWMRVKKFFLAILLAALFVFLVFFCTLPQIMAFGAQDYFSKSGKSSTSTFGCVGKSSHVHCNQKKNNKFVPSSNMNGLLRSMGEGCQDCQGVASEQERTAPRVKPTVGNQRKTSYFLDTKEDTAFRSCATTESSTVENYVIQEASKDGKLTVRTGKDKGRRRKKKKVSGSGLTGIFEVSSSQSGNSTPSSPLSPVTSLTPKRPCSVSSSADQLVGMRNQFAQVAEQSTEPANKAKRLEPEVPMKYSNENCFSCTQEKPSAPRKMAVKPVLLASATFPCTGRPAPDMTCSSPFLASTSTIAPHARAPGSKLYNQKAVETEEHTGLDDQFKYDIWGDHLSGLHLVSRSRVSAMTSSVTDSHSDSFFARGPQTLMEKSEPKSVSCSYEEG